MQKRAQLTIFIIIGVVLILSVGTIIYLASLRRAPVSREVVTPTLPEVPVEVQPIKEFVTTCIAQVSENGLRLLGEKGGYIDPVKAGLKFNSVEPTDSELVELVSGGPKIPYWWYMAGKNDCIGTCPFSSKRPSLFRDGSGKSIEEQLDEYIKSKLRDCTSAFKNFKEQGFEIEELGEIKVETSVAKKGVNFFVRWPLLVRKAGAEFRLDEFFVSQPVALADIYELGTKLANLEAEFNYLERMSRNLIDSFSDINPALLPPISDVDFSPKIVTWLKSSVARKLQQLLMTYVQFLQVIGSRNYVFVEAPVEVRDKALFRKNFNTDFAIPIPEHGQENKTDFGIANLKTYPNIEAKFAYLGWKPYFDLNCKGELCQPQSVGTTFPFQFNINRYSFAYDLSFPVLVTLTDPDAYGGKGYTFQFFLEGNLRNNEAMSSVFEPLGLAAGVPSASMFCDIEKRIPNNITVTVFNGTNNKPMPNVVIYFACGDEACAIGETGEEGSFTGYFPGCFGGVVSALAEDSYPAYAPLDTYEIGEQSVNLTVEPYRYVNFEVKKHPIQKKPVYREIVRRPFFGEQEEIRKVLTGFRWETFNPSKDSALPLADDEEATITMTRLVAEGEEPFVAVGSYAPGIRQEDRLSEGLRLIPGTYEVKIQLLKRPEEGLIIPPEAHWARKKKFLGGSECVARWCVPSEKMVFNEDNPLFVGEATLNWTLTKELLDSGNTIVFYVPYLDLASLSDKCYLGETPVGPETNWHCGQCVDTFCERTLEDLSYFNMYQDLVGTNIDEFIPDVVKK